MLCFWRSITRTSRLGRGTRWWTDYTRHFPTLTTSGRQSMAICTESIHAYGRGYSDRLSCRISKVPAQSLFILFFVAASGARPLGERGRCTGRFLSDHGLGRRSERPGRAGEDARLRPDGRRLRAARGVGRLPGRRVEGDRFRRTRGRLRLAARGSEFSSETGDRIDRPGASSPGGFWILLAR